MDIMFVSGIGDSVSEHICRWNKREDFGKFGQLCLWSLQLQLLASGRSYQFAFQKKLYVVN